MLISKICNLLHLLMTPWKIGLDWSTPLVGVVADPTESNMNTGCSLALRTRTWICSIWSFLRVTYKYLIYGHFIWPKWHGHTQTDKTPHRPEGFASDKNRCQILKWISSAQQRSHFSFYKFVKRVESETETGSGQRNVSLLRFLKTRDS